MRRKPSRTLFPDDAATSGSMLAASRPVGRSPILDRSDFRGRMHFVVAFSRHYSDFRGRMYYFVYPPSTSERRRLRASNRAPWWGAMPDVSSQQSESAVPGSRLDYATEECVAMSLDAVLPLCVVHH